MPVTAAGYRLPGTLFQLSASSYEVLGSVLLHAQQISLAFGHLPLFDNADLRIEAGDRLALIGRNGTGKSTLLKVLAGELPPDRGMVWRQPGLRIARLDQSATASRGSGGRYGETSPNAPRGEGGEIPGQFEDRTVYQEIARGLSNYSAADASRIHGRSKEQIAAVLGSLPYPELVHRDNLVVTGS